MTAAAAPNVLRLRALRELRNRRTGQWIRAGQEFDLDMNDEHAVAWARQLDHRGYMAAAATVEFLEGEIPPEVVVNGTEASEPEVAANPGRFADLTSRENRKRQLIHDEDEHRRRERLAEAQAQERAAKRALGQKPGADGDAPKLEKALADAQANANAKQAALDAFLEETYEERAALEAALHIAEAREAAVVVDALRRTFEAARRKQILAFVEFVNVQAELADAHQQLDVAAGKIGQHAPTVIWLADQDMLRSWRDYVRDCGIDVAQDHKTGRWTAKARDAR